MNKIYEVECQRSNITPKQFFTYCKKQMQKKGANIENWIDEFMDWINPIETEKYHTNEHSDWDVPYKETIKIMPYDWHLYLQNSYNFIMEFDFDDDKKGHGYMYAIEFEK